MRKWMHYAVPLLFAGIVLAVIVVAYDRTQVSGWLDSYSVRVTTQRTSPRPVASASVAVLLRVEWTGAAGDLAAINPLWRPITVADGAHFDVDVKCGGNHSGLGRQIRYVRQDVLLLKIDYADGDSRLITADIPESQSSREMVVQVP
jgi:hypothetical protein